MGLFSSKKKKIVGVSNTRLIPKGENPQAIKDSVATYISDFGASNGNVSGDMVDYMNYGIDNSIVRGIKRLDRWVKKEDNYSEVGSIVGQLNSMSDDDIRDSVESHIKSEVSSSAYFYYLNNIEYDYAHFVRQVLIDKYSYNPSDNSLSFNNLEVYLDDAVVYSQEPLSLSTFRGPAFTSGYTPNRVRDTSRSYSSNNIVVNPGLQFDSFIAQVVVEATIEINEVVKETIIEQADGTISKTIDSLTTDITNNIETNGLVNKEYLREDNLVETTNEETSTDSSGITTTIKTNIISTIEYYLCMYEIRDNFESYLFSQEIDWDSLTEQETIDKVNSISEEDIVIQVGYEYVNYTGETIVVYESLTKDQAGYLETENELIPFGNFLPNLYFRTHFNYMNRNKESAFYKQSKKYGKKINLNFDDLIKQVKEEMSDQDKIMYIYLKFGINFYSEDIIDISYLFHFFAKYFKFCDTTKLYGTGYDFKQGIEYSLSGKYLNFNDKVLKYDVSTSRIVFFKGSESVNDIGTFTRGGGEFFSYFRLQVTSNTYEEYRIYGIKANNHVTEGKWAASGGENSDLIIPVDFDLLINIKGFRNKERLIYNSMYIEFLTLVIQKIRWHERGVFKLVVLAVSIGVSVFLGPVGVTLSAVISATITNIVIGIAIDVAIKFLVKILNPKLLRLLALALVIGGLALGSGNGLKALGNSASKAFTILVMKADLLVQIGTKLSTSAVQAELKEMQESFLKEAKEYKDKMNRLDEYKLKNVKYSPRTDLNYLDEDLRYNPPLAGESMDELISRSLNTNPALVAINYVHNYVDFILELPKANEVNYKPIDEDEDTYDGYITN